MKFESENNIPSGIEMKMEIETGSRPSIEQRTESHFDATFDQMLAALKAGGDEALGEFLTKLSAETKENLAKVLNQIGWDWQFLVKLGKENSASIIEEIGKWERELTEAVDEQAKQSANSSLADSLEGL